MKSVEPPSSESTIDAYCRLEQAWQQNEALGAELQAAPPSPEVVRALAEFANRRRILYIHLQAGRARRQLRAR